ncbi:MAG: phosphotransferase [Proteobacteria bacterium]|nr:phosphotransferase [Pseudomonadota bacterium]
MSKSSFEFIAADHRETAHAALRAAFGAAPVSAIRPVPGGVSGASVFRVETGGRRYVLRIEGEASPLRNPHQYASMQIAAEAGIAPRIHYVNEQARVAVTDFIETQPLAAYPGRAAGLARALGELLAHLQATKTFPHFVSYPDIVARLWAHVCRTGLFAPGVLDVATERLARIRDGWNSEHSVSSHNDVLPRNILFDGRRLWLIDWESAYRNDPLVDVATALDNFAPSPELETVLLRAWLGRAPGEQLHKQLAAAQALTRLYYAGVLFSASALGHRSEPDKDISALSLDGFTRAIRGGRLKPDTFETSHALGKMYLASFLSGERPPGLPPPLSAFQIEGLE